MAAPRLPLCAPSWNSAEACWLPFPTLAAGWAARASDGLAGVKIAVFAGRCWSAESTSADTALPCTSVDAPASAHCRTLVQSWSTPVAERASAEPCPQGPACSTAAATCAGPWPPAGCEGAAALPSADLCPASGCLVGLALLAAAPASVRPGTPAGCVGGAVGLGASCPACV